MTFFFDHDVLEDAAFALEAMGHQVVGLCQVLPMKGVTRLAKATAGQFNIGVSICRNLFPIPIAPLNEQLRIVETLDELFSDLDAGVAALERVRTKLRHYRAAVLKAAVEGALTAEWRKQHPATEPASALLTRILAERRHRCHVLIDLKIRAFQPADVGQMNFYVNWFKANMMAEGDNPPVGILLCSDKDGVEVEFATAGIWYSPGVKANVIFFEKKEGRAKPWTDKLWVYDLRTNKHFTLKQSPIQRTDFDEFVERYKPGKLHTRKPTWTESNPEARWRCYDYDSRH